MLSEYRKYYANIAERIPDYKKLTQLELADGYLRGGINADAYLAALIIRYWNIPVKLVAKDYGIYDEQTAYDWYINAVMYAVNSHPWTDEKSSIYNDPKAVERTLNTCVSCDRANWFQASNRYKRKVNHGAQSLNSLSEEYSDAFLPSSLTIDKPLMSLCKDLVTRYFNRQQYLMALVIDVISTDINIENTEDETKLVSAIKRSIRSLPENYSQIFADNYSLPKDKVDVSFEYIYNMNDSKLRQSIENYIHVLRIVLSKD